MERSCSGKYAFLFFCFWSLIGILFSGTPPRAAAADDGSLNLLAIQKAKNALLEAELARLRQGLTADPCGMAEYLGMDLRTAPVQPQEQGQAASSGQSYPTLGELLEQATVLILVLANDGTSIGTGFFITPDTILTNKHVTDNKNSRFLIINQKIGRTVPATLRAASPNAARDYALLTVDPSKIPAITPLIFNTNARRTDKISAWGYPLSVSSDDPLFKALGKGDSSAAPEVVYSEGVISVILDQKPPVIMHSAMISQGNSGGPLVNQQGEVLGINTRISLDKESYRQMGISLASSDILAFLHDNGITP